MIVNIRYILEQWNDYNYAVDSIDTVNHWTSFNHWRNIQSIKHWNMQIDAFQIDGIDSISSLKKPNLNLYFLLYFEFSNPLWIIHTYKKTWPKFPN